MKYEEFGQLCELREVYGDWREMDIYLGNNNNYAKIIRILYIMELEKIRF